jgi:hypothetical protein
VSRQNSAHDADIVRFRNGYAADAPVMDIEFLGVDKRPNCCAIRLGKILSGHSDRPSQKWRIVT